MASFSIQRLLGLNSKDTAATATAGPALMQQQLSAAGRSAAANAPSRDEGDSSVDVEIIDVVTLDCEPVTVDVKTVSESSSSSKGRKRNSRKRTRDQEATDSLGNSPQELLSSESDGETAGSNGSTCANNSPHSGSSSGDESTSGSGQKASKRLRTAFTVTQLRALEYSFRMCPYPDSFGREQIAKSTGIDEAKIQVWFQNRRARYRKREKPLEPPQKPTIPLHLPLQPPSSPATPQTLSPAMLQAYYAATLQAGRYTHPSSTPSSSPSSLPAPPQFLQPPHPAAAAASPATWYTNPYASYFSFPTPHMDYAAAGYTSQHNGAQQAQRNIKKYTGEEFRSPK